MLTEFPDAVVDNNHDVWYRTSNSRTNPLYVFENTSREIRYNRLMDVYGPLTVYSR